jgi:carboxypeptidase C (cathepsin A)
MKPLLVLALISLFFIPPAFSEENAEAKPKEEKKEASKEEEPKEELSVTKHTGTFGGKELKYTATAGTMIISKKEKDPKASMFHVAYTLDGVKDPATRPITFCFNGGPGSSGVWLHLGGFGPKRVQMTEDGMMPNPPFRMGDNPESILRVTDLVFIDPVSTGFSRSDDEKKANEFHGFQGDLDSMAEFIRLYTTRNGRWLSPKFLAGESYGAFRAAGLAQELHSDFGLYLNGIILVSGVLSFDTLWGSDLAYVTFLPALSETAAYHQKLAPELLNDAAARRAEVEAFATGEYAAALLQGGRLPAVEKEAVAARLSRFTGIDVEVVKRLELRIPSGFFREELLREEGMILGRFDSRVKGRDGNLAGNSPDYDPSYAVVYGPFSAALNDYVRRDLKFESDLIYEILSSRVRPWDYGDGFVGQPVNILPKLASVMSENPALKVMVNCGYQDLATPYSAIRHSLDHLDVDPALLENIEYSFYEGGHMMYTIEKSNTEWNRDVARFIEDNSGK